MAISRYKCPWWIETHSLILFFWCHSCHRVDLKQGLRIWPCKFCFWPSCSLESCSFSSIWYIPFKQQQNHCRSWLYSRSCGSSRAGLFRIPRHTCLCVMRTVTVVKCCDQQVFDCFSTGAGLCVEGGGMRIRGKLCGPTGPGRICVKSSSTRPVQLPESRHLWKLPPYQVMLVLTAQGFSLLTYFSRHLLFPPHY